MGRLRRTAVSRPARCRSGGLVIERLTTCHPINFPSRPQARKRCVSISGSGAKAPAGAGQSPAARRAGAGCRAEPCRSPRRRWVQGRALPLAAQALGAGRLRNWAAYCKFVQQALSLFIARRSSRPRLTAARQAPTWLQEKAAAEQGYQSKRSAGRLSAHPHAPPPIFSVPPKTGRPPDVQQAFPPAVKAPSHAPSALFSGFPPAFFPNPQAQPFPFRVPQAFPPCGGQHAASPARSAPKGRPSAFSEAPPPLQAFQSCCGTHGRSALHSGAPAKYRCIGPVSSSASWSRISALQPADSRSSSRPGTA